MNTQEESFDKNYPDVYEALESFLQTVLKGEDSTQARMKIVDTLVDTYSKAFYTEISYLLDQLNADINSREANELQNSIDTSAFRLSNQSRIMNILISNEEKIKENLQKPDVVLEEVKKSALTDLVRLALSETHMTVEKASVNSSKLTQSVLDVKLRKTWNCVGDGHSCDICLAMNGISVPVEESFANYAPSGIASELMYTGGDTTYAHPRCRCWLTYSEA